MASYLPIVLGQDALQWLRHLPRHCIDDWSDFSRRFTANIQSLSNKPAQPWDLKSIKRQGDETLWSYLKRFQTMRNRISEVAEAAVIEDFYRGSNDSAFVRTILQKAPTTSEQLFREADLYITADERAQDLNGGVKPAPAALRRDTNQQPDKRWEKRRREEVHAAGPPASRAPGRTSRRRTHAGRHPRRSMPVPQGHAPHPSELQGLQALRRARPTLPASTSSSATRRTGRTAITPAARGGRRWSLPACRQRGQCHLR
jgi:hypothetical protein